MFLRLLRPGQSRPDSLRPDPLRPGPLRPGPLRPGPLHSNQLRPASNSRFASLCQTNRGSLIAAILMLFVMRSVAMGETWTSLQGDRTVEAKMLGLWDDKVVLLMHGGRRVQVPMDSLNAISRIQARKLGETLTDAREQLRGELQQRAKAEAAPAPNPLPVPEPAQPYSPPQPDMQPDEALQHVRDQLRNGHPVVLYDALPMKYRGELNQLGALILKKLDANDWNNVISQLHGIADLMVSRQNWIQSHPRMTREDVGGREPGELGRTASEAGEVFQKLMLPAAGAIRSGLPPEQSTPDAIATEGVGQWLQNRDKVMAPYLAGLMEQFASFDKNWTVLDSKSKDENESIVQAEVSSEDGSVSRIVVAMSKIDGYWVPKSVADGFADWVKKQTASLEEFDDGSMSLNQWLGGQAMVVPEPKEESGYDSEFEEEMYDEMDDYDEFQERRSRSNPTEGQLAVVEELEPAVITSERIGTALLFVQTLGRMTGPLEAAENELSFHQAVQELASPISSWLDMIRK